MITFQGPLRRYLIKSHSRKNTYFDVFQHKQTLHHFDFVCIVEEN